MDCLIKPDYNVREKIEFQNKTGIFLSDLRFNKLRGTGMPLSTLRKLKKN